jgi:hypothetical protein
LRDGLRWATKAIECEKKRNGRRRRRYSPRHLLPFPCLTTTLYLFNVLTYCHYSQLNCSYSE